MPLHPDLNPLVAALDAGRLVNRLRFHLEQAWFGYGSHRRAASRTLGRLGLKVRTLVQITDRREHRDEVVRPFEEMINRIGSEGHHLTYEDWADGSADDELTDDDFRRAVTPVFEAIDAVRGLITRRLDDAGHLAFSLGEVLDQGACPTEIHRYLGRPRQIPGQPEGELDHCSIGVGEEEPDSGWHDELRQILIELATALEILPEDMVPEPSPEAETSRQLARRIATKVEGNRSRGFSVAPKCLSG